MDAVAAGLGADVIDRIADARGDAFNNVRRLRDAEAEDVDERIAGVRRLERNLTADRRDADAVAVAGDAGHDAFEQSTCSGRIDGSEPRGVQKRGRPRVLRGAVLNDSA